MSSPISDFSSQVISLCLPVNRSKTGSHPESRCKLWQYPVGKPGEISASGNISKMPAVQEVGTKTVSPRTFFLALNSG
ncbi:hypothetical protein pdam_00022843 [Pocillopora damicornis]|uniref:Uncharacterized protein n=1 Tax=Pocillopora damicornis TaxID=46731 RepID=A0A3M6T4L1_POCDA|nr:hypothetical protein pdam_00022843 [Pocillopora damicornis]